MSDELLEAYIRQLLEAQRGPVVTIAWQGRADPNGHADFYKRSIDFEQKYARPGRLTIEHTMQTNGILLNEAWCDFFCQHQFLIGLSLDGPQAMHDTYRLDKGGGGTHLPQGDACGHGSCSSTRWTSTSLTTVNAANADHPEVYRFLRDEVGTQFMKFIPIVERINEHGEIGFQEGNQVSERSVKPEQWGTFLMTIFDEWVRQDVGRVFVPDVRGRPGLLVRGPPGHVHFCRDVWQCAGLGA